MSRRILLTRVGLGIVVALLASRPAQATSVTYTFEPSNFVLGEVTPLINRSPNVNPGSFLASFTDTTTPGGYTITKLDNSGAITGQALFAPTAVDALTLTFNTPVDMLTVNFAINAVNGGPVATLRLVTPSGTQNHAGSNVGGAFQGGTLVFSTGTAFTTATLQGFLATGAPTQIEIDNLQLQITGTTSVPEPATLTLMSLGLVGFARRYRRA